MLEKFLAVILFVCSALLIIVGLANQWVLHILFGFLAFAVAEIILQDHLVRNAPFYDEEAGRYYRFVTNGNSPHHARCPRCKERSKIIYTTSNKRHYGVYCYFHGPVWVDLEAKEAACC